MQHTTPVSSGLGLAEIPPPVLCLTTGNLNEVRFRSVDHSRLPEPGGILLVEIYLLKVLSTRLTLKAEEALRTGETVII